MQSGAQPWTNLQQQLLAANHVYFVSHGLRGVFCSRESQVSLQDSAVTDARARSEARSKLLSVILYFELGYQGWGEQALPFCHPWFARVCLV